ncbi:MAG: thioredoxin [Marivirga sp.]|nr:thioredoxin [Marivirga sp.]
MENMFRHKILIKAWRTVKPWALFILVFLILRFTGALSGISYLTSTAMMKTGAMDAAPEAPAVLKKFDYDFSLKDLNGTVVDVNQFKGKTIFLNIWATWCGPCRVEMPSIQKLYEQVDNEKILFIMLTVDRPQDLKKVKDFVTDKAYTFPVYTPVGVLPTQLQVGSIPSTFIIGPDGKIVSKETGAANYDTPEFKAFLEKLILP